MDGPHTERSECALLESDPLVVLLVEEIGWARIEDSEDPTIALEGSSNESFLDVQDSDRP
jgi:hypothetical protein